MHGPQLEQLLIGFNPIGYNPQKLEYLSHVLCADERRTTKERAQQKATQKKGHH